MGISFNEYSLQAGHLQNVSSFDKSYSDEGDDNDEAHQKHDSHKMKFICLNTVVFLS